jgi:hypothetical protein
MGRVTGATTNDKITGLGVEDLKEQDIDMVAREYMKILGVSQKYEGRADKALIDEVKKTISVVRGENVEVQQAKLAETFMNYFGRKLTTRYGSKGVSITPTAGSEELSDIISNFTKAKIKLDPYQNLGVAITPKTMGKLATELFDDSISEELKTE